jgi:hypothetical protein
VDGVIINTLSEGESYSNGGDTITINKIKYNNKETLPSQVNFTLQIKPALTFLDFCVNSAILNEFY